MKKGKYKCCFTGYRPSKMPFSLDREDEAFKRFENSLFEELLKLCDEGCTTFYSGMAMGFDIIAAEAVLLLKEAKPDCDIKMICVLPFKDQGQSFTRLWRDRFNKVLEGCDKQIILSDEYFAGCYQKRNEFMVDNCDFVLTWYDGKAGGTRNTLDYAAKKQRFIVNINKKGIDSFAVQTQFKLL